MLRSRPSSRPDVRLDAGPSTSAAPTQAVVRESLERLHDQMRDLEHSRVAWQSQLHQQVADMRPSTESLRRETQTLSTALRRPQVRGRWGELHLRRAVELAGMVDRCDFSEQVRLDDGALRPDLVVHLAGGRQVVVDAKVPLDAYLDATAHRRRRRAAPTTWPGTPGSCAPTSTCSAPRPTGARCPRPRSSWCSSCPPSRSSPPRWRPTPACIEHAAARQVVLATPTTLIALLRTVAHGWSHEALADQARGDPPAGSRPARAGSPRSAATSTRSGRSLNAAVGHYNGAVGSLESRVLVAARRFADLAVTDDDAAAPTVALQAVERARGRPATPTPRPAAAARAGRRSLLTLRWPVSLPGTDLGGRSRARPRVVALGLALALTAAALDLLLTGRVSILFDLGFVALCLGLALAVRPRDFFTVGVLPPLLMLGVFLLLGFTGAEAIAAADDGVVAGGRLRAVAPQPRPGVGYVPCLVVLPCAAGRGVPAWPAPSPSPPPHAKRSGSPAPRLTTSGAPLDQSTTVVGSAGGLPGLDDQVDARGRGPP